MRVRISARKCGTAFAAALWCVLVLAVAASATPTATPTELNHQTVFVQASPKITEPTTGIITTGTKGTQPATPAGVGSGPMDAKGINLDFHAADITDVLKALSIQSGVNIVTGSDVKGLVTVTLNKVSMREALDMITKLSGFKYAAMTADTYIVGTTAGLNAVTGNDLAGDRTVFDAIPIRYANPADLAKAVQEQLPTVKVSVGSAPPNDQKDDKDVKKATVDDVPKSVVKYLGTILVSGPESDVAIAREIISRVEETIQSGGPETVTKVYQIKYADAQELVAMITSAVPGVSVAFGPRSGFERKAGDMVQSGYTSSGGSDANDKGKDTYELKNQPENIVLTGFAADVDRALKLVVEVDIRPMQILIEAKVIDLNNEDAKDIGVEWTWDGLSVQGKREVEGTIVPPASSGLKEITRTAVFGPATIQANLNLMVSNGKAKLLASPQVAMVSGKPARIFIGDEVRYISETVLGPGQSSQKTEVVPVGILLDAVGVVGSDDEITLYLHPEVSTVTKYIGNIPQIARRYTDSTIRVKNGGTVVIGGLIRDEDRVTMSQIPLLGDLPVVGRLFKSTSRGTTRSEVTIFITATILKD